MCTSVYPPLFPQTVFAQTESNEITLMTHDTFIEGSFHLEVFTLFESMPSSKLLHHQYVDVLFVPPVTVTSVLRILHHTAGGPGDCSLEVKVQDSLVQPFSKIDPKNPPLSTDLSLDIWSKVILLAPGDKDGETNV